jgi:hypothetical protein
VENGGLIFNGAGLWMVAHDDQDKTAEAQVVFFKGGYPKREQYPGTYPNGGRQAFDGQHGKFAFLAAAFPLYGANVCL